MSRLWQMRRNTSAGAAASNPILAAGEPGFETDTGKLKIGDGSTEWVDLGYAGQTGIVDDVNTLIQLKNIGQYNPVWNNADTTTITGLTGSAKWIGGVLGPDGKIYGIPFNSDTVLIIDPVAGTADTTTITGLTGADKWRGGVLGPDGKIYGIPNNSASVLIISGGFPSIPITPLLSPYLNKF